jgi:hypothetical protein
LTPVHTDELTQNQDGRVIVPSLISSARPLEISVVPQAVEYESLIVLLQKNGNCRATQEASAGLPRSEWTAPADDPEQDDHDGNDQEDMDEAAHGDGGDQTQQPQDDQDYGDGIKHVDILSWLNSNFLDQHSAKPILGRFGPLTGASYPFRGAAVHRGKFPLRVALALCAGIHTPQVFCRTLCTYKVFAPCRCAAISSAPCDGLETACCSCYEIVKDMHDGA